MVPVVSHLAFDGTPPIPPFLKLTREKEYKKMLKKMQIWIKKEERLEMRQALREQTKMIKQALSIK